MDELQTIKPVNAHAGDRSSQEKLPAVEVDNELLWLNPVFEGRLPFDISQEQIGHRVGLALFFDPHHRNEPAFELGVRKGHTRSGDFSKIPITAADGRQYRDIDLKGCGGVDFAAGKPAAAFSYGEMNTNDVLGLFRRNEAELDSQLTEFFSENGIRTHRSIAIFGLKEIPVPAGSPPLSVESLKEKGHEPVIQMRAFGTKTRVSELVSDQIGLSRSERTPALQDACALVSQEFPGTVSDMSSYIHWFAGTLGNNIGKMHALGYVHQFLSGHNITLDCRITDLTNALLIDDASNADMSPRSRRKDAAGIDRPGKKERNGPLEAIELLISRAKESFPNDSALQSIDTPKMIALYKDSYKEASGLPFPEFDS